MSKTIYIDGVYQAIRHTKISQPRDLRLHIRSKTGREKTQMGTHKVKHLEIPLLLIILLAIVSLACSSVTATPNPTKSSSELQNGKTAEDTKISTKLNDTPTSVFTETMTSTKTSAPTITPKPPTATRDPNIIQPGSYMVGTDIQPGIYRGEAGDSFSDTCYWARLKDMSGSLDAILANDNSVGQFYIEVLDGDYGLETACNLLKLSSLPLPSGDLPVKIEPGTYIVGRDIRPGTYKGQAGSESSDSCYWERLKNVQGDLDSIIANDNAVGQFYILVMETDFALSTACELEWAGD